jgi:predicted site-specific integrase-resolvase
VIIETRELVAPTDAAARLGVTYRRFHQIVAAGRLPGIVASGGRRVFRVEDLEKLIRERSKSKKGNR